MERDTLAAQSGGPLFRFTEEERRAGALTLFRPERRQFQGGFRLFGRLGQHAQFLRHRA